MRKEGAGSEETQGNFTQVSTSPDTSRLSHSSLLMIIYISLFRRFKIFDCPHCSDKFCTQDDLERHLAKIEKNNIVEGSQASQIKAVRQKTKPVKEPEPEPELQKPKETEKDTEDKIGIDENNENVDTTEIVKELEAKTYSCSECGLKTHSRMTYIQHVLNGCIMDMVLGEVSHPHCR